MKKTLVATKPLKYATRRLQAGDSFEASNRDARILIAVKRAKESDVSRDRASLPPPPSKVVKNVAPPASPEPAAEPQQAPADDIAALREEYSKVVGKKAFNGWSADELRRRMAEASKA